MSSTLLFSNTYIRHGDMRTFLLQHSAKLDLVPAPHRSVCYYCRMKKEALLYIECSWLKSQARVQNILVLMDFYFGSNVFENSQGPLVIE